MMIIPALLAVSPMTALAETAKSIDMKMLVVSADGTEQTYTAITTVLDQIGIPYDTLIASETPLTALRLSDGQGRGHYQGIFLSTGNLGYLNPATGNYESALTTAQWQLLAEYESSFRVRQATLFTYPEGLPDYGLKLSNANSDGLDTGSTPLKTYLTPTGKQVFSYLNPASPLVFRDAWAYLATPGSATNPVPLLKTAGGYAIASIYTYPDSRQNLTVTADGGSDLIHSLALGYGIINWVSKGFFLGERRVYMNPQVDDILLPSQLWDSRALSDETGLTYRIKGTDFQKVINWQGQLNTASPNNAQLRLEMAFNGVGATSNSGDTLTPAVRAGQNAFKWISHTYDHESLDDISYADAMLELQKNNTAAIQLGFQQYAKDSLVQPNITGLNNPAFLLAASTFGLTGILSDTSEPNGDNPSPNAGLYSPLQPGILIIPRNPTNLYYNVSTPAEWTSEYNYFYAPGGQYATWDHALSYQEILSKESDMMLGYLLKYSMDPLMFHQANLRAYNGVNSTLGDLIKATLVKYNTVFNLPVRSPSQHAIRTLMNNRMTYNASGVTGSLVLDAAGNRLVLKAAKAATVPLTGISYGPDSGKDNYGGQTISAVQLSADTPLTIPAPAW